MQTTYKLKKIQNGILGLAWVTVAAEKTSGGFDVIYAIDPDNSQSVKKESEPQWINAAMTGIRTAVEKLGDVKSSVRLVAVVGASADTTPDAVCASAQMATFKLFGKEESAIIRFDGTWICDYRR